MCVCVCLWQREINFMKVRHSFILVCLFVNFFGYPCCLVGVNMSVRHVTVVVLMEQLCGFIIDTYFKSRLNR